MTVEAIRQRLNDLALECGFKPLEVVGRTLCSDIWSVTVNVTAPQDVCHVRIYDFETDEIQIQFSSMPVFLARPFERAKTDAVLLMRRNGGQNKGFWRFDYEIQGNCQQFVVFENLATLDAQKFYNAALEVISEDQWWQNVLEERARTWADDPWE